LLTRYKNPKGGLKEWVDFSTLGIQLGFVSCLMHEDDPISNKLPFTSAEDHTFGIGTAIRMPELSAKRLAEWIRFAASTSFDRT